MPGPARKVAGRQRTNTPEFGLVEGGDAGVVRAAAPKKWLAVTVAQWEAWWSSDLARLLVAGEEPIVLRMFDLLDQAERCEREGRKEMLVAGSTGQLTLNPLLKHAQSLRDEARRDEAVIGRGPKRRLDLGVKFGEAARSIDDVNRRLARAHDDQAPPSEDPRLSVVEADSRPA